MFSALQCSFLYYEPGIFVGNFLFTSFQQKNEIKLVITWSCFAGIKFQPVQPGQISPYDYINKSIFIPQDGASFHLVFVYKNPRFSLI